MSHSTPDPDFDPESSPPGGPWPWGGPAGSETSDAEASASVPNQPAAEESRPEDPPAHAAEAAHETDFTEGAGESPSDPPNASAGAAEADFAAAPGAPPSKLEKNYWGVACHLSGLLFFMVGLPFLAPLGPLVVWNMKREELPQVADQGREALNFQLNVLFWTAALFFTCIGAFLIPVVHAANVVLCIVATVKTVDGENYRYPGILRVVQGPGGPRPPRDDQENRYTQYPA